MPALFLKLLAQKAIEVLLLLLLALAAGDLKEHDLVGAGNAEPGVLDDHACGTMLVHDLVAVALGHAERLDDGAMSGVEQRLELTIRASSDKIETKQRHVGGTSLYTVLAISRSLNF